MSRSPIDPARISWVQDLISRVMLHNSRINAIMREFGIKKRMAERYIVAAREEISRGNDIDRVARRDALRLAIEGVVDRATESGDHRAVVSGLRELTRLDGVCEVERVAVEHSGALGLGLITDADPTVVAEKLTELRKKQGG